MTLRQHLRSDCITLGLRADSKQAVLSHIAALTSRHPACHASQERVYEALLEREALGSTGFDKGVAIPHTRLEGLSDFVVGLITLPAGVEFDSPDGQATRIVAFILGPPEHGDQHLQELSTISRILSSSVVRDGLLAVDDARAAMGLLQRRVPAPDEGKECEAGAMLSVFVQVEAAFLPIMQAVSAETACASVVEGGDVLESLHVLPLYSRLWARDLEAFHRIIFAVVDRDVARSLAAEISQIAAQRAPGGGVLVAVQELGFCYGSLKASRE